MGPEAERGRDRPETFPQEVTVGEWTMLEPSGLEREAGHIGGGKGLSEAGSSQLGEEQGGERGMVLGERGEL